MMKFIPNKRGIELWFEINEKITGRICGWPMDGAALYSVANRTGNHLEIGTAHGGSAILAAIAKKENHRRGKIHCVDPLDGYYGFGRGDNLSPEKTVPSPELVMENAALFGVEDLIVLHLQKTPPLPKEIKEITFTSCYLDGQHAPPHPTKDFNLVRDIIPIIALHDLHKPGPGVVWKHIAEIWEDWEILFEYIVYTRTRHIEMMEQPDKYLKFGSIGVARRTK